MRVRQLLRLKLREITIVRYPSRDRKRNVEVTEQYDDIFSQLIVPNFFNRIIKLLDSLAGFCRSVRVELRKNQAIL